MQTLKKDFPPGVDSIIIYDPTIFIAKSVNEVIVTIFVAILLVVGVVFVFLQSWRATIVPVIAIPVSLVGTFTILAAFGISLNNLSLFGLVLAVGIVVDDAIVVVENVERNMRAGMSPREAAHRTMDEVGGALISIALTLCAVFVPSAFLSGISGLFFRQFAVTISASTVISCFVSLTLSPALCAVLFKPHYAHDDAHANRGQRLLHAGVRPLQSRLRAALLRLRQPDPPARARHRHRARGLCRPHRGRRRRVREDAHRVHPGAGPGLSHLRRPAAAGRHLGPDREGRPPRHRHHPGHKGHRACGALRRPRRYDLHRRLERWNDLLRPAVALQSRAAGRDREHRAGRSAQAPVGHQGCVRPDDPATARAGPRQRRRLQDDAGGPGWPRLRGTGQGRARARRRGQQGSGLRRRLHALQHGLAVGLRRHRPPEGREGGAHADRRVLDAPGLSRLAVRQRLQLPRPELRGRRPGRRAVPAHDAGHLAAQGTQHRRRDGADRNGGAAQGPHDPVPRAALQSVPRGRGAGRRGTGRRDRHGAAPDGGAGPPGAAEGHRVRMDRSRLPAAAEGHAHAARVRRPPPSSSSSFWSPSTRAGSCRSPSC